MSTIERVTIHDEATDSCAEILAGFGFNCFRFRAGDEASGMEVLWAEEGFETGRKRAAGSGMPILFPFPGRIKGVRLPWKGREYALPAADGQGNAIHGFVHTRPWRVLNREAERVTAQFQASIDDPVLAEQWPADFRITATYEVSGLSLSCRYFIENTDDIALPCGLGTHPYFRMPSDPDEAASCVVTVPVTRCWELEDMNATGEHSSAEGTGLAEGLPYGDMQFDNVFGGLVYANSWCRATIHYPDIRREMELRFDDAFRECVVYNPPHRQAVCVEPYTCVPDCFRLQQQGVDAGLRVLEPGDAFTASVQIEVREHSP